MHLKSVQATHQTMWMFKIQSQFIFAYLHTKKQLFSTDPSIMSAGKLYNHVITARQSSCRGVSRYLCEVINEPHNSGRKESLETLSQLGNNKANLTQKVCGWSAINRNNANYLHKILFTGTSSYESCNAILFPFCMADSVFKQACSGYFS